MPTVRLALALALGAVFWAFGLLPFAWAYNGVILLAALWELSCGRKGKAKSKVRARG